MSFENHVWAFERTVPMDYWVWAILLLVLGLALAVLDIFLPSGGMFAFLAVCAIIAAIVLGFFEGSIAGFSVLTAAIIGTPIVIAFALKWFPNTPMGRKLLLRAPTSEEVLPEDDPKAVLQALVGRTGRAKSKMLPSGMIAIGNCTYDAVGEGPPIDLGQRVRVVEIRGRRIIVEGLPEEPSETDQDPLARPVDWAEGELFPPPQA